MKVVEFIVGVVIIIVVVGLLFSFPVMWLWNYLMPDLFGLKTITLFQSWCLLLLTGLLFRGVGSTKTG
jgi:hypothetical protein